jgi:hypothetical protein
MRAKYHLTSSIAVIACLVVVSLLIYNNYNKPVYFTEEGQSEAYSNAPYAFRNKDDANARFDYEQRMLIDPSTGVIPKEIHQKELIFASKLPSRSAKGENAKAASAWDRRGPYNVGGRTRALAVKSTNSSIILAGGVSGGLWRSTDSGVSWTKSTGVSDLQSITAISEDPVNANTWYYTTGELLGNSASGNGGASYRGDGVYKSTDDGVSWTVLASTSTDVPQSFESFFDFCWNVKVDPTNGNVYVATYGVIHRSTDGGVSFNIVLNSNTGSSYSAYTDLVISSTGVLYVTMGSDGDQQGVFRSTDGTTWVDVTPSFPTDYSRVVFDIAASNENILYFLGYNSSSGAHFLFKYTYVSGDGSGAGGTWVERTSNIPAYGGSVGDFDSQGAYDLLLKVKPDDEDVVFIAGTNLYRSIDGFATSPSSSATAIDNIRWIGGYSTNNNVSTYTNSHPDMHSIAFIPGSPDEMLVGNDGGVQLSTNNLRNVSGHEPVEYTSLNNGYFTTQAYSVGIDRFTAGDNRIIVGLQDNGKWSTTTAVETDTWGEEAGGGDGTFVAIVSGQNIRYAGTQNGSVARVEGSDPESPTNADHVHPSSATGQLFVNPFMLDKNDEDIMYYPAGRYIWRHNTVSSIETGWNFNGTNDSGWSQLTGSDVGNGSTISALDVSDNSSADVLYYGTDDGQIYKLTNAQATSPTSTEIYTSKGLPSGAYVSSISVDPDDSDNVMVTFSNYSIQSVFYTTDGGTSWTDVSGNLEENTDGSGDGPSVRWAAVTNHASLPGFFVGTSTGLYSTSTLNGTSTVWEQEGDGNIGNVVVAMVAVREVDGTVVVGTHGNGVYSYTAPSVSTPDISFEVATSQAAESTTLTSGCLDYTDYTINMTIENGPTGDAIVTLSSSGTATDDYDFEFTTNSDFSSKSTSLTFPDGDNSDQSFQVRVYDDEIIESDENIVFTYIISGTTDAQAGSSNQTFTYTINDNDETPSGSIVLFSEDFEGGAVTPTDWLIGQFSASASAWVVGTNGGMSGSNSAYVSDDGSSLNYDQNSASEILIRTSLIDGTGESNMQLSFDFKANGQSGLDYGSLMYTTDAGGVSGFLSFDGSSTSPYVGVTSSTQRTVTLPSALDGQQFYLGWKWDNNNNTGSNPPFTIDNIVVTSGSANYTTATALGTNEQYLGPNQTVYYYDDATGDLIARIENTSSHDYGCTTIAVDRAGNSGQELWNAGADKSVADKTYLITPANNNVSGAYNVRFYFTETEIAGWETISGKNRSVMTIAKSGGSMSNINPLDPEANGTTNYLASGNAIGTLGDDIYVDGSFSTGFSGFAIGDPGMSMVLPIELLSFEGRNLSNDILLEWISASERNTDKIFIERSVDGKNFRRIGEEKAQGDSFTLVDYSFLDQNLSYGRYYYRLKMIDLDATFEYSKMISVVQTKTDFKIQSIYPNPVNDFANIYLSSEDRGMAEINVIDQNGRVNIHMEYNCKTGINVVGIDASRLQSGSYVVTIRKNSKVLSSRFIKL